MKLLIFIFTGCVLLGAHFIFFSGTPSVTNVPSSGTTLVAFGDSLIAGVGASQGNDFVSILARQVDLTPPPPPHP